MFGALLGAAIGAAGSIAGAVSRNKQIEQRKAAINRRMRDNENWYNRRYNEDVTQRADAQRLLAQMEESIRRRNKAAEGRKIVMGGTDESVALEKEVNSAAYGDALSQMLAYNERRKDAIEQQYLNKKEGYEDMKDGLDSQRASGLDILGGAAGGAVGGLEAGANVEQYLNEYRRKKS